MPKVVDLLKKACVANLLKEPGRSKVEIRHLVQKTFETTALYTSIRAVEPRLLKNSFLVVLDQEKFAGTFLNQDMAAFPVGIIDQQIEEDHRA